MTSQPVAIVIESDNLLDTFFMIAENNCRPFWTAPNTNAGNTTDVFAAGLEGDVRALCTALDLDYDEVRYTF